MNRLLKTSSMTGSTVVPTARRAGARRRRARARRWSSAVTPRPPARLDDGGRVALGDDRRAVDDVAPGAQPLAHDQRGVAPAAAAEHAHASSATACRHARVDAPGARFGRRVARADRLDRHRLDDQPRARASGTRSAAGTRPRTPRCRSAPASPNGNDERRVGALVAQVHAPPHARSAPRRTPWRASSARGRAGERVEARARPPASASASGCSTAASRITRLVRQAHAVGRQHAGQRMHEDAAHAERVGDAAGVLAAGAAEALQRVARHVVAARDRDLLDRVGHAADGDVDEALGHLLGRARRAGRRCDLARPARRSCVDDDVARRAPRRPAGRTRCGKYAGWILPSITLASVTVSGPPRR